MSDPKNPDQGDGNSADSNGVNGASFDVSADVKKLQEQSEKFKNDFLYLRAEFENYKKHAIKERSDLIKYAGERMAKDLLGVLDNFERALSTNVTAENFTTFKQGVEMTANELRTALGRHGITEVKTEGQFDPNVHEALSSEKTTAVPAGHIARVFQKAYKMHDKLIRPAQVVVAQSPE